MQHKLGIVGFGGMGSWHADLIKKIDGLSVAGICDIEQKRMEYASANGMHVYTRYEDMLSDPEVELILVATPNDLHNPLAIQAMQAGKHVVAEKPVTLNVGELLEVAEVSRKTGMFFTVHQNRRWDEDFLAIRKIYQEGMVGKVYRIESRVHGSRGIPGDWRQEPEKGGGMVLDWGVHLFDQVLQLLGDIRLTHVHASLTNITNQMVDDGFTALLSFENGVEIVVEVGTSNFISLPRWYVQGRDGTAIIQDWNLNGKIIGAIGKNEQDTVPVRTAAGITKTMAPRREDTIHESPLPVIQSDIRDFYRNVMGVIEGKEQPKIKLPEVLRVMKLMEAVFASAESRQVIRFE
ncbi:MAG: Gfo/Idh/MocA family protein [Lachnospiraceae bacterium]